MGRFAEYSRRALRLFLVGFVFLVLVAGGIAYLVINDNNVIKSAAAPGGKAAQLVTNPANAGSDQGMVPAFLVPSARIADTQTGRENAPADTLTPGDWQTDPNPGTGPNADAAAIPTSDRQLLASNIQSFLQAWETFTPPLTSAQSSALPETYVSALSPWVAPAELNDVANRVDNQELTQICPAFGCQTGSEWLGSDVWDMMNVRYYSGGQAYVTVNGFVRFHDDGQFDGLANTVWERSYGLLLENSGSRWLVDRAAAVTVGQYNIGGS